MPLDPVPAGAGFRLSPPQERLWTMRAQAGASLPCWCRVALYKPLPREALLRAAERVVARHEILGTRYARPAGAPLPLQIVDTGSIEVGDGVEPAARLPFDLEQPARLRLVLEPAVDDGGDGGGGIGRILLAASSLNADVAGLATLCDEIIAEATAPGTPFGEEPVQYADAADWLVELPEGEGRDSVRFWQTPPRPDPLRFEYPFGLPPPGVAPGAMETISLTLPGGAAEHLLAAFAVLAWRLSRGPAPPIGLRGDGRFLAELRRSPGLLARYLPLDPALAGHPTLGEVSEQLRGQAALALRHQMVFRHGDDASWLPLVFEPPPPRLEHGVIEDSWDAPDRFVLRLRQLGDDDRQPRAAIDFDRAAIDRAAAESFGLGLQTLLEDFTSNPSPGIDRLQLLAPRLASRLVTGFNQTTARYETDTGFDQLLARQARRDPERIAVIFEGESLSYGELDRRAALLAARLQAYGVGPEVPVTLSVERSLEALIGICAVIRAGGAYVPLDVGYPKDRLEYLIADTRSPLLLTHRRVRDRLPAVDVPVLCIDDPIDPGSAPPRSALRPHNLIYVIYTSGSTGKPKGVAISHHGLVMSNTARQLAYAEHPEKYLLLNPFAFDSSVVGIFWTLAEGGTLVLIPEEDQQDPARLARALSRHGITHFCTLPSVYDLILEHAPAAALASLRTVIVAGEACPRALIERHKKLLPSTRLYSEYGATETSVWSSITDCRTQTLPFAALGVPVANTQMYVLDPGLEPLPPGATGEVYFGGDNLARGYWSRPDLTAERFLPDPFAPRPGARLYRSGDLARWAEHDQIEFLGRADQQVKVRGFRIELGEIEAALAEQPGVREAVVAARDDGDGKRLVAYVVTRDAATFDPTAAREALRARLPAYMVPARWAVLEDLPRLPNGKVDRKRLPAPESAPPPRRAEAAAPSGATEEALARILGGVLRVEGIGRDDNFFDLGLDSILGIQVVALAAQAGIRVAPRDLFRHQTVAALATRATAAAAAPRKAPAQGAVQGPVPLTPIQRWFLETDPPEPGHFNMAMMLQPLAPGSPAGAAIDLDRLAAALAATVRQHDALSLRFTRADGTWHQAHAAAAAAVSLERADLSALPGGEIGAALTAQAEELQRGLDLARGPLLRARWVDLGAGQGRLLIVAHHLVFDGVSWRILLADLGQAYAALERGEPVQLGAKTASFRQWAESLVTLAATPSIQAQEPYWREVLARSRRLPIPAELASGESTKAAEGRLVRTLEPEETAALLTETAAATGARIDEILAGAFALAWRECFGASSLALELEGHGREDLGQGLDVSRTVGWFTTFYPVVIDLAAGDGPLEAVARASERLRSVPDRGFGYTLLRYLSGKDGEELAIGVPQVNFNYLGQFDQVLRGAGLLAHATEPTGADASPRQHRRHALDMVTSVIDGRLTIEAYLSSGDARREAAVDRLATAFATAIRSLIASARGRRQPASRPAPAAAFGWNTEQRAAIESVARAALARSGTEAAAIESIYPLSPLQQGLLYESVLRSGSSVYLNQFLCRFAGGLDVAALERAFARVSERHGILRTGFLWEGLEEPVQVVLERAATDFTLHDLGGLGVAERAERLEALLAAERARPLALDRAPLMRFTLLRLDPETWQFVWTFHHLLLDGWSLFTVLQEAFAGFYPAFRDGADLQLDRPRPYRDHIAWVRAQDRTRAAAYWRRTLAGFRSPTPLGGDRGELAPSQPGADSATRALHLEPEELASLQEFATRHRLTLNTLVAGAWSLLLARRAGEEDVVFGTTVSGRPAELEGAERMVGLFINTLPVRVRTERNQALVPWLVALQDSQAEMREFEWSSLGEAQAHSDVARGRDLFASFYMFENYRKDATVEQMGASLGVHDVRWYEATNYPIAALAVPEGGGGGRLELRAVYQPHRLDPVTVDRWLGQWRTLLRSMVASPEAGLGALPVLAGEERRLVLETWNRTAETPLGPDSVVDRLAAQARERPDAVAIAAAGAAISYRELAGQSDRLAGELVRRGIRAEDRIAILAERSIELAIAEVAVLRAGGAYVPLDPAYPAERLRYLIEDSGARLLLVQERFLERASATTTTPVLSLTPEPAHGEPPALPPAAGRGLAYVIYTSGSSGRPKPVGVEHRALANLVAWHLAAFALTAADRTTLVAGTAFDASAWELWPALAAGATLHIPDDEVRSSPEDLRDWLLARGVTVSFLPTPLAEQVLPLDWPAATPLRILLTGGEKLNQHPRPSLPFRLVNNYGPTENAVVSTSVTVPAAAAGAAPPPIGAPIDRTQAYVLDPEMEPVPIAIRGELMVGGASLARGYLGRPDLTAERFVPSRFGAPGARLYRTGDLARFRADGNLEFCGRLDHQVKVRGHRIELGEIESALAAQPGVAAAVVMQREDEPDRKRLVAYVVAAPGPAPLPADLQAALARRLPEPMLPQAYVFLERFPLTPNGKVDRQHLPAPDRSAAPPGAPRRQPGNPREAALAGIFARALGLEQVSVEDDFFALGGDSILSLRIVSEARAAGIPLTPRQVFSHPTVAELAALAPPPPAPAIALATASTRPSLTPIERWFFAADRTEPQHFNQAMLLRVPPGLDATRLEGALAALCRRHDALRMRFRSGPPGVTPWLESEGGAVFERVSLADRGAEQRRAAIEAHATRIQASLDLAAGPLVRAALFATGGDDDRLLLVVHHLVVDVVSWSLLLPELEALHDDAASPLPAPSTPFTAWSAELDRYAASEAVRAEAAYWLAAVDGEATAIPRDRDPGDADLAEGTARTLAFELAQEPTRALLQDLGRVHRVEVHAVLLTALVQAFAATGGRPSLCLDVEGHGREDRIAGVDLSRTVGWFTALYPVTLRLVGGEDPGGDLRAVREQLGRIPGGGLGYGLLRYPEGDTDLARRLAAAPRRQVLFNYLGRVDLGSAAAGWTPVDEPIGALASPRARRSYPIEVNTWVSGGVLRSEWTYSPDLHRAETITGLGRGFLAALGRLIAHGQKPGKSGYSPADFPAAALSQDELDAISSDLEGI